MPMHGAGIDAVAMGHVGPFFWQCFTAVLFVAEGLDTLWTV